VWRIGRKRGFDPTMKVSHAIAEILCREGIDVIFGYPRNAVLETAAAMGIRTVIVRQERTGLHMADAYSRMSRGKRLGVFAMQHGPGTENAYGAVAQAWSESVPVLVLPQGYARRLAHVPGNYNACISMRDITKSAEPILRGEDVPAVLRRAFTALRNGRLRPALVELPWDVLGEEFPGDLAGDIHRVVARGAGDAAFPGALGVGVRLGAGADGRDRAEAGDHHPFQTCHRHALSPPVSQWEMGPA